MKYYKFVFKFKDTVTGTLESKENLETVKNELAVHFGKAEEIEWKDIAEITEEEFKSMQRPAPELSSTVETVKEEV